MASFSESPIPNPESRRFVLVAGETSGDLLGADLIRALRERFPDAAFAGIGGPQMIAAGFETWHPMEKLSVMGLVEVLSHLPGLLSIRRDLVRHTIAFAPDAFIGIDAPDFNLGVERRLKRAGVRTVHYVSPSVWAWREKRAAKIGRSADLVLCLFPMEPPIYARHGVDAVFIGHPLADEIPLQPDHAAARAALGEPADVPILALLPGSRLGEIRRMLPTFLEAARLLRADIPGLRLLVPAVDDVAEVDQRQRADDHRPGHQAELHRGGAAAIRRESAKHAAPHPVHRSSCQAWIVVAPTPTKLSRPRP